MTIRVQTLSGATYILDDRECIWHRIPGPESETLRSQTGIFVKCIIAERLVLHCPAYDAEQPELERIIVSSIIESIETIEFGASVWRVSS